MASQYIQETIDDPGTSAFCFYAKGPTHDGVIGMSNGKPDLTFDEEFDIQKELLAFHLFELQEKYQTPANEVMKESVKIFNAKRETWKKLTKDF